MTIREFDSNFKISDLIRNRNRIGKELSVGSYVDLAEGIDDASSDEYHDYLRVDGPDQVIKVSIFGNHAIVSVLERAQINRDPIARGKLCWFPK